MGEDGASARDGTPGRDGTRTRMSVVELYAPVCIDAAPPEDPRIATLIWWAARFAELGFTPSYGPGDHGNLSCRTPEGLIASARQTQKARLTPSDFTAVFRPARGDAGVQPPPLRYHGVRPPSTDALMHLRIYEARPDVHAILHGHDPATLAAADRLRLPVTATSGLTNSEPLVEEVVRAARAADYLLMRDHGFVALGRTIDEAGELVRTLSARARGLSAGRP
jgi:L-fuculose-phosphate aldolase